METENISVKTALITGASRGVGRSAAARFAREGYRLFLCCKSSGEDLKKLCSELSERYAASCIPIMCDVSDPVDVSDMFDEIRKRTAKLDVLVNNAGVSHFALIQDSDWRDWRKVMDTNAAGVFSCSRHAASMMLQQKNGSIINISSIWGISGASMETIYSASKGAVNAFTRALAKELAPSRISVNALALGVIDTDMNLRLSEEERRQLADQIPAGRFAGPEEAADMIYMLAEAPAYLTGQVISFDGGFL